MSTVRLTNDWVSAAVESGESLHLLVSVIFWWNPALMDGRIWLWLHGTLASTHPLILLLFWKQIIKTHIADVHACTHTLSCRYLLTLCSLHQFWHFPQTSAQSEAAGRKPPEHTSSLVPRKLNTELSVILPLLC